MSRSTPEREGRDLPQVCVFVGPTRLSSIPAGVDVFAPAALGSVFRAVENGYQLICLIDGYFGNIPSVWHKEILYALDRGVAVWGAASIGALRAAELDTYGMTGFGWVYRAFRCGALTDDDEVCVVHAVAELDFAPLSEAMVNIRCSLRELRRRCHIDRDQEHRIAVRLKALHFARRDAAAIHAAVGAELGSAGLDLYERTKVDIKTRDAATMLAAAAAFSAAPARPAWTLPVTNHWINQFVLRKAEIPALERWTPGCNGG